MGKAKIKKPLHVDQNQRKISSFFTSAPSLFTSVSGTTNQSGPSDSSSVAGTSRFVSKLSKSNNQQQNHSGSTIKHSETLHNLNKTEHSLIVASSSSIKEKTLFSSCSSGNLNKNDVKNNRRETRHDIPASDDSDLEFIECTPEAKVMGKSRILPDVVLSSSPDFLPPTPQVVPVKKSVNSKVKGNSSIFSNLSTKTLCKSLSFKKNTADGGREAKSEDVSTYTSTKRPAVSGCGISPDGKRVSGESEASVSTDISACKSHLMDKFNTSSESEAGGGSFSLLQPLSFRSGNEVLGTPETAGCRSVTCEEGESKYIDHDSELPEICNTSSVQKRKESSEIEDLFPGSQGFNCSNVDEKLVANNEQQAQSQQESKKFDMQEPFIKVHEKLVANNEQQAQSHQESKKFGMQEPFIKVHEKPVEKQEQEKSVAVEEKQLQKCEKPQSGEMATPDMEGLEDCLDAFFEDDLMEDFKLLSPFKPNSAPKVKTEPKYTEWNVEEVGQESYAAQGHFGRHLVTAVHRDPYKHECLLQLLSAHTRTQASCTLRGFWADTAVREGNTIHVLFTEAQDGHFIVDSCKGAVVVNPDFLISGTAVVSGVFCRRKAVLSERYKGIDGSNKSMLIGSLVHQLFQEVVKRRTQSREELQRLVGELVSQPWMLRGILGLGVSQEEVTQEMSAFLPHIQAWLSKYLLTTSRSLSDQPPAKHRNQWTGRVLEVQDIEENFWSPKHGVKGKIDMTVKTRLNGHTKVMPLELKTGRSSFSQEHRGQLNLYSLMSCDRRPDPEGGLLLYLRDGAMEEVPARDKEKQGLLHLRNEIVHYLTTKPDIQDPHQLPVFMSLPHPIDFEKACTKCEHLLTCSLYQKAIEQVTPAPDHPMASLVPQSTAHLSQDHLTYFQRWCLLLHLEAREGWRGVGQRGLWCHDPAQRESSGSCVAWLVLDPDTPVVEEHPGQFLHTFTRSPGHHTSLKLAHVGLQSGESVVVSSKKEIALSQGAVALVAEEQVCVVLDRDLKLYPDWRRQTYHVDRYEYQNNMGINFANLARLMRPDPRATTLRTLLIDRSPPVFKSGLPPKMVPKFKELLNGLNKVQMRAVLKILMAEDYSLLRGYPGTGKTMTIVAMVRLMVSMGMSVLLTSHTHSAVDNILLILKEQNVDFLRLGRVSRLHADIVPYSDEVTTRKFTDVASLSAFYESKQVVATTCLGINHVIFSNRTFDFCIVDEASQVLQPSALGPLFHARRFVLVGDPRQLPPVIKNKEAKTLGMGESLFVRLDSEAATCSLTQQYRMNGPIMAVANHLMYNNQLQCAQPHLEHTTLHLPHLQEVLESGELRPWVEQVLDQKLEHSVLLLDTCGAAPQHLLQQLGSLTNPREAGIVVTLSKALIKVGVACEDIGVITPYRAQVRQVREGLGQTGLRVEVNTVDQYQGRDKKVILYSCVRSNITKPDAGEILMDDRRLNVAVTRARHKLVVVGDRASLLLYPPFQRLIEVLSPAQVHPLMPGVQGFHWDHVTLQVKDEIDG